MAIRNKFIERTAQECNDFVKQILSEKDAHCFNLVNDLINKSLVEVKYSCSCKFVLTDKVKMELISKKFKIEYDNNLFETIISWEINNIKLNE